MDNRFVHVPLSLLLDPDLTASTKLIWLALRLSPTAGVAELAGLTGLSDPTIRQGMRHIPAPSGGKPGARVKIPGTLLAVRTIAPQAKLLYGLLQATPQYREQAGQFTYVALSSLTGLSRATCRQAMADLAGTGWVQLAQATRLSPITFTLGTPELRRSYDQASQAQRRLKRAKFGGEAIMHEYLSLLIDSDQFTENARPGFLINPLTGERLELDRFYPPHVAFEYHGAQHFRASSQFSQAQVDGQHLRDLIKAGLCLYRRIHLVIVEAEDLSLQGMLRKIGQCLPLRDLAGHEPLIELLEDASMSYQASAGAG